MTISSIGSYPQLGAYDFYVDLTLDKEKFYNIPFVIDIKKYLEVKEIGSFEHEYVLKDGKTFSEILGIDVAKFSATIVNGVDPPL